MPNDGYAIQNGRLITGTVVTSTHGVEVCRFTVPANTDTRINTLCFIQNQSTASDGYSYWLDALVVREIGNAYIAGGLGLDGYGSIYNASGILTEMTISISTDGYDVVFVANQTSTDTFRLSTFSTIYQVENTGFTYLMGITITDPTDESPSYNPTAPFYAYGTIESGEHVVLFSGNLDGGDSQLYTQTGDTWEGDGFVSLNGGSYDLTVTVTYDNAEVRTAVVTIHVIAI